MIYFFDNCISPKFPEMLRALGEAAEALRDNHPQDIEDVPLIQELLGRPDLVFISTDTSQTTRLEEAKALKQAGNTALYFGPFFQKMKLWDQAVWIVKNWPKIRGFAEGVAKGTCAEIKQNGKAWPYVL